MNPETSAFPPALYTIWAIGLGLTLFVFVPLAVYMLHSTWRGARSIQLYAAEALAAAGGIAKNTANIPALDSTIAVATQVLAAAVEVDKKLDTVANVMASRAS